MIVSDPFPSMAAQYPYDPGRILAVARGLAYVAIMLDDGHIGVCATLGHQVETDPLTLRTPDYSRLEHRILCCAYFNASHNSHQHFESSGDIFEMVDFSGTSRTVMVGDFQPLVARFRAEKIPLKVYDLKETSDERAPIEEMPDALAKAERVIMTSTTIFNGTFTEVLSQIGASGEIFLLGPSTPLAIDLFGGMPIKRLCGMVFEPFDFNVLNLIAAGHGTRSFSPLANKVSLKAK